MPSFISVKYFICRNDQFVPTVLIFTLGCGGIILFVAVCSHHTSNGHTVFLVPPLRTSVSESSENDFSVS